MPDDITSYWARHTWATIASQLDIPKDVISRALGHSFGVKTTDIYIKFDDTKIDEANRRVIDYVLYDKK
jgi:integrase